MGTEVRSSGLETGLSSSASMVGAEADTVASVPSSIPSSSQPPIFATPQSSHAFKEECSLKEGTFSRFKDRFQFLEEARARLPRKGEKSCAFAHGKVCFYQATFLCGLRFPVHPFIMEFLHYLTIALR